MYHLELFTLMFLFLFCRVVFFEDIKIKNRFILFEMRRWDKDMWTFMTLEVWCTRKIFLLFVPCWHWKHELSFVSPIKWNENKKNTHTHNNFDWKYIFESQNKNNMWHLFIHSQNDDFEYFFLPQIFRLFSFFFCLRRLIMFHSVAFILLAPSLCLILKSIEISTSAKIWWMPCWLMSMRKGNEPNRTQTITQRRTKKEHPHRIIQWFLMTICL